MPSDSRRYLVQSLLHLLPEQSSPVVISVKPDQPRPTPIRTNGSRHKNPTPNYDPSIVFILELATLSATRDSESVASMGQSLADALQTVVRDATNVHPLALSRSAYYLLYLLNASQEHSFIRAPVVLHTISSYDQPILEAAEKEIAQGLAFCVQSPSPLRSEMTNTPDFWLILRGLYNRPSAAGLVFSMIKNIVESKPGSVTADNYENAVSLLNGIAAAGSVGAAIEQQRDKRSSEQPRDRKGQKAEKAAGKTSKEYVFVCTRERTATDSSAGTPMPLRGATAP